MALPQGIAFRGTAGYVTDFNAYDSPEVLGTPDYMRTTAQGNVVGWETGNSFNVRNRVSGNPSELAGMNQTEIAVTDTYRIDLPSAGDYKIRFAAGDGTYSSATDLSLYDGATLLTTLSIGFTSAANRFKDATNTEYTAATWRASNTQITKTFATTILRIKNTDSTNAKVIAYLSVDSAGGGPPPVVQHGLTTLGVGR